MPQNASDFKSAFVQVMRMAWCRPIAIDPYLCRHMWPHWTTIEFQSFKMLSCIGVNKIPFIALSSKLNTLKYAAYCFMYCLIIAYTIQSEPWFVMFCFVVVMSWLCFYQTRLAWSVDQGSNKNHSPAYNFAPTVTKFCVMWEGLSLPHDTKCGNCRCKIVDSRAFPSWSLIHGLRWSGLIKAEPEFLKDPYFDDNLPAKNRQGCFSSNLNIAPLRVYILKDNLQLYRWLRARLW